MTEIALAAYAALLAALLVFAGHRAALALVAWRRRGLVVAPSAPVAWPRVVVQIPIYNEAFVARRAIEAAGAMRYAGPLELQVLDDSSDDSREETAGAVKALRERGIAVELLRREARVGYKAGALAEGLRQSAAELVAIFDADFVPPADFLERAVPVLLSDPRLGLVQARWGHLNRDESALTAAQALALDAHFSVEHGARHHLGHPFNFNGTAGVWRRAAIEGAGGWSSDTVTEDLDLSYRALLAGWRFAYADAIEAPAELPETWLGYRAQQARWVRGGIQTAKKLLARIWRAPVWTLGQKLEATLHLSGNVAYVLTLALALALPALVALEALGPGRLPAPLGGFALGLGLGSLALFYAVAARLRGRRLGAAELLLTLAIGAGMSLSNALEVARALFTSGAVFLRTPKRGGASLEALSARYGSAPALGRALLEGLLAVAQLCALPLAFARGLWGLVPCLAIFALGFGAVSLGTAREALDHFSRSRRMISVTSRSSSSSRSSAGLG